MSLTYSSVFDAPRDEVFAWHARPGAIHRLSPPWQSMRVRAEAASLADGRAELRLPGGLRWVAQHQPGEYDPPRRFVDTIDHGGPASLPAWALVRWRHSHEFDDTGDGRTRLTDRIDTVVPGFALQRMFAYRHRQLAADLAVHARAAAAGLGPLTIAVTGASGLVGSALVPFLTTGGHTVIRLVRRPAANPGERQWNPADPHPDLLSGVDAVIHLAGESVAGRFTEAHRRELQDSRLVPTRRLAELVAASTTPVTMVSASGIGYYGARRGDEVLTEDSERGDDFLAQLAVDWEAATAPAEAAGQRVVRLRIGIVQSPRGGTLGLQLPLFRAGLGGRLGDGRQWLSWIGIDDLIDIIHRGLWDTALRGPVNVVAPNPVRNFDYTRTLGRMLRRPTVLPVPALGPRLLLGKQGAAEMAQASQRVAPARLQAGGHVFRHQDLEPALRHLLGRVRG
ncbi:TIGR01777 family oxidoreductase [Mycobacterium sp. 1274756.6]|uniref:TIGR01777 family oxidoreductase n=1 Tax=Mycobacterium sp. 1274756.6 TaxID=1834076 RepID=UPI0007FD0A85|nr:TIGR01777 family oxidoreductase [Mycobacterium sp. 1274756.6]OBJ73071.1 TIGR01777 family protein [Mycobacterium sp. 1274756.6]